MAGARVTSRRNRTMSRERGDRSTESRGPLISAFRQAKVSAFGAIVRKDLRLELRSGESTITLGFLSILILIVLTFALNAPAGDPAIAAGALWVAIILAGTTGATRVMTVEWQNGCIQGLLLSPADRAAIYCAKLLASFIFM